MNKSKAKKLVIPAVLASVILLLPLHYLGIRFMDEHRIVETLMAPGAHNHVLALPAAVGFIVVRFLAIVYAPAALLALAANVVIRAMNNK